ncbi:MAG: DNA polymerase domain-containing protein [Actinomycetota bacterium]|nr:DNA polymerase domain-containing protein [Actinomycetota bacterium]
MPAPVEVVAVDGLEVRITNPGKVFFPQIGFTKLDLVQYYLRVMPGALVGCCRRPTTLYRWPNGVDAPDDAFYQKRVPDKGRPEWLRTVTVKFPSGRSADMLAVEDAAHLLWAINLGCLDINPWPIRVSDVDHPDELRVDLDPTPGIPFSDVRVVAAVAREVIEEHGLAGFPKTSGKRGIHIFIRIHPAWGFKEVRRAALALAREVERRAPTIATTAWWKEERRGVFVDYNQNARDRTIASAYSVRPVPDARVSAPLTWDEVAEVEPEDLTVVTVPDRFSQIGDPGAEIDAVAGRLESLLDLSARQESAGLGEAPLPPHFPKEEGEPARVMPSRRRQR